MSINYRWQETESKCIRKNLESQPQLMNVPNLINQIKIYSYIYSWVVLSNFRRKE